jgi:hypothetical protein
MITAQPDLPGFVMPTVQGIYLAYLDVWNRAITYVEDGDIREEALAGPDTATRLQTVWQVKLLSVANIGADVNCASSFPAWDGLVDGPTGRLRARAQPSDDSDNACIIPPGAGFRRLENQLYRVEIHDGGANGVASFKWSRENGSVVAGVEAINGDEFTVSLPGHEPALRFSSADWVELTDDRRERRGEPATLVQVLRVDGDVITVDTATATGSLAAADFPAADHPKMRRWDGANGKTSHDAATNDGYLELEDGSVR